MELESRVLSLNNDLQIEVYVLNPTGSRTLICLPSLGRSAKDFVAQVFTSTEALRTQDLRLLLPEPRLVEKSTAGHIIKEELTLHHLAADVANVMTRLNVTSANPAVVLGHAFGNKIARTLATDRPDLVKHVILLAAGGLIPVRQEIQEHLFRCFEASKLSPAEHLRSVKTAFFAKDNDPSCWRTGWYPNVMIYQYRAAKNTPLSEWWSAGQRPVSLLQGLEDAVAPAEDTAEKLRTQFGDRISVYSVPKAGHALLPEQPNLIRKLIFQIVDVAYSNK